MSNVDKTETRLSLLKILNSLSPAQINEISQLLTTQMKTFFSHFPELTNQLGGGFLPMVNEVHPLFGQLQKELSLSLAYPILDEASGSMNFAVPKSEPKEKIWLNQAHEKRDPAWLIIPGLAFDLKGYRLGRGKGFYDRYLMKDKMVRIGVAWSKQLLENVPSEKHDQKMDFIVTEKNCWNVNQQRFL